MSAISISHIATGLQGGTGSIGAADELEQNELLTLRSELDGCELTQSIKGALIRADIAFHSQGEVIVFGGDL
jgi:hypothetical protein